MLTSVKTFDKLPKEKPRLAAGREVSQLSKRKNPTTENAGQSRGLVQSAKATPSGTPLPPFNERLYELKMSGPTRLIQDELIDVEFLLSASGDFGGSYFFERARGYLFAAEEACRGTLESGGKAITSDAIENVVIPCVLDALTYLEENIRRALSGSNWSEHALTCAEKRISELRNAIPAHYEMKIIELQTQEAQIPPHVTGQTGQRKKARRLSDFTRGVMSILTLSPDANGLEISRSLDLNGIRAEKFATYEVAYKGSHRKNLDSRYAKIRNKMRKMDLLR